MTAIVRRPAWVRGLAASEPSFKANLLLLRAQIWSLWSRARQIQPRRGERQHYRIIGMSRRTFFLLAVALAGLSLAVGSPAANAAKAQYRGRKYKAPPPTSRIDVTILRADDKKPIGNAAVVFRPIEGDRDKGNMELRTDEDGKTMIDVLPIGDTVRVQVIARGYETFGQDYKVEKPQMTIEIHMKRPGQQYSIYEKNNQAKDAPAQKPKEKQGGSKDAQNAPPAPSQPQPKPN